MTLRRIGLLGGIFLLGVACRAEENLPPIHEAGTPGSAANDEQVVDKAALPMPEGRVVSFAAELQRISKVRGLPAGGELHGLELERDELLAHVERAVDLETPEAAMRGTGAMLVGLGVAPRGFDYKATFLSLLSGKLAGLYDPRLHAMLIRKGLHPAVRDATLLHELVHALQDQNYQVRDVVEWSPDDTDRSGALSALAEGDATSATLDMTSGEGANALSHPPGWIEEKFREDTSGPEDVPTIIQRSLKASYIDGITFVHALRRRGGWKEVNRVWERPPVTTEQLLHLDKYDAQEAAKTVPVPRPPQDGTWTLILHDIWGEQNLRLIFEEWMSLEEATRAAAGWGGDRIVAYSAKGQSAIAWHVVADDESSAIRMRDAFAAGLPGPAVTPTKSKPELSETPALDPCGSRAEGNAVWAVTRRGTNVVLVSSPLGPSHSLEARCEAARGYLWTHLVAAVQK